MESVKQHTSSTDNAKLLVSKKYTLNRTKIQVRESGNSVILISLQICTPQLIANSKVLHYRNLIAENMQKLTERMNSTRKG